MKLRNKINIYISVVVVAIFFVLIFTVSYASYVLVFREQKINLERATADVKDLVETQISFVSNVLRMQGDSPVLTKAFDSGNFSDAEELLRSLNATSSFYENIFLTDRSGTVRAAVIPDTINMDLKDFEGQLALEGGETFYFTKYPIPSPVSKHPVIVLCEAIMENNTFLGALCIAFDLQLLSEATIVKKHIGNAGYSYVIDDKGVVIMHPNKETLLKDVSKDQFIQDTIRLKSGVIWYTWENKKKYQAFDTISGLPWIVCSSIYRSDLVGVSYNIIKLSVIIAIISLLVLIALSTVLINRTVIRRINTFERVLEVVATGDLTQETKDRNNDEITMMNRNFNKLITNFKKLIGSVFDKMNTLRESGGDLSANMTETASAIIEINSNIDSTKAQINNQATNISQTSAIIEELTKSVESLKQQIDNQAKSVSVSSSAIEEMISNIQSITKIVDDASNNIMQLKNASEDGQDKLNNMKDKVDDISKRSENLIEANTLIKNIASQTNLLAMNAAIEAAHAGEYGKGFAVVADEIRKLAEVSTNQSKIIETDLRGIKDGIDSVVSKAEEAESAFVSIREKVQIAIEIFAQISSSIQEQATGSSQILGSLTEMKDISHIVQTSAAEMNEGNKQILIAVMNLNNITNEIKSAMDEISTGTYEINRAVTTITELSVSNKENIAQVDKEAEKFKIQ